MHRALPGEEPTGSSWVRIKGRAGKGDILVGFCYRPANQEGEEALYRQIVTTFWSQALVLMGGFNHPDISVAGHKQFRRFLGRANEETCYAGQCSHEGG